MNDLIINVAAGLITSVLAPLFVLRRGGGSPPSLARQSVAVQGDNNAVNQIDASVHEYVVYESVPSTSTTTSSSSTGTGSADDPWVVIACALLAAGTLVLAYMLIWPVIVWAFAGAAVGIAAVTTWTFVATRDTPGPRRTALTLTLISSCLLLLAAWWTLHGGPGSPLSGALLESEVLAKYPTFDDSITQRWETITSHPGDVLQIVGFSGMFFVLTQVLALESGVFLVWARAREVSGWYAMRNLVHQQHNPSLARKASHFKGIGLSAVGLTAAFGLVLVGASGGWVHTWVDDRQEHQADSLVAR